MSYEKARRWTVALDEEEQIGSHLSADIEVEVVEAAPADAELERLTQKVKGLQFDLDLQTTDANRARGERDMALKALGFDSYEAASAHITAVLRGPKSADWNVR